VTGNEGLPRIVVGVDGSPPSLRALRWALGQAALTHAVVEAVNVWDVPASYGVAPTVLPGEDIAGAADRALAAAVEQASSAHPDVTVRRRVAQGHPAEVLLAHARDADLLVVGSHGHGGFVGALLGSVSHRCIQHATCPVVVVRTSG
jgi:nucleotide-binding universal stress UspA family protein